MKAKLNESLPEIDAEFDLAFEGSRARITVHARGGAASGGQTNPGYEKLLQVLLERLKALDCRLDDVRLASKTVAHLPAGQRRVRPREYRFPLLLSEAADVTELRYAIRRAVLSSHSRSARPTHGNATKRIELIVTCPVPAAAIAAMLVSGNLGDFQSEAASDPGAGATYLEGGVVLRQHLERERNRTLVVNAKAAFMAKPLFTLTRQLSPGGVSRLGSGG